MLVGKKVVLRTLREADLDRLYDLAADVREMGDYWPVDRIQATTIAGGKGSQAVLKKCGFQFEGVMRKAIFHRGQSEDLHLFSLLRDDCGPLKDHLGWEVEFPGPSREEG